jgi:hypothetical protein
MKVGLSEDAELYKRNARRPESGALAPLSRNARRIPDSEVQSGRKDAPVMDFTYLAEPAHGR